MEGFDHQYPQKPIITRSKSMRHPSLTVLSIVVFALTFYLIIDDYFLIGILLCVLLLHELGHFLMMKLFKYEEMNILFIPFIGAMVSGRKKSYSQVESALMIIAGPLPGIILGSSLLLYGWLSPEYLSIQFGVMLIVLNVFNLIPVEPLDGGQLMRVLFFRKYESVQLILTVITTFIIIGIGVYFNLWVLIIGGLLLGFRIKNKHKLYLIRKEMKQENIKYEANYDDISNQTFSKIKQILIKHTPILKEIEEVNGMERFEQIIAKQVDGVLYPPTKKDASVFFKIFILILWLTGILISLFTILSMDINKVANAF